MNQKIKNYFQLTFYLARSGFILRNEGSYLGILWYILNPTLMFGLLYFVFSHNLGSKIENYEIYLLLGIIMFNFFQTTTNESTRLIRNKRGLFKSINIPRSTFILGNTLKFTYSHLFELIIFIIFSMILNIKLYHLILYPLILMLYFILIYGTCLILGSVSVFFSDLNNIWNFITKILWFVTPLFYEIEEKNFVYYFNQFNPIYYFIEISRNLLIYNKLPSVFFLTKIIGITIIIFILGILIFNRLKYKFAERI